MQKSRAQIVATIGPASKGLDVLRKMAAKQMNAARLNFSHGTYEEHAEYISRIKQVASEFKQRIPIIQDLSGPRQKTAEGHKFQEGAAETITEKDRRDLAFGLEQDIDYVAMSYVGNGNDILQLKQLITEYDKKAKVIAKIERQKAVDNIDQIIKVSDAIMVARGDLGTAIPLERVPFVQEMIIKKCNKAKKPVITATQMLLSMVENPTPTRAEVSDVAHAILDGSDAIMLSEETAIGKHPAEAVAIMERIALEAEKHSPKRKFHLL